MPSDATVNVEIASPLVLRAISSGSEAESLVGCDEHGNPYELRVLSAAIDRRLDEIEKQLSLIELVDHPSIRPIVQPIAGSTPASFKMGVPFGVDPVNDRLGNRLEELSAIARFRIAASIVNVAVAAHRVGLYHGSFCASSILVSGAVDSPIVNIDYSSVVCSENTAAPILSVENDLEQLLELFSVLIEPVLDSELESIVPQILGGRQRAILRQWFKERNPGGSAIPPTLGQWQSLLEPFFLDNNDSDSNTGIVVVAPIPCGSGSTSRIQQPFGGDDESFEPAPRQLSRFRIDEKIGEGGMGTVYRGTDLASGETVAVKVLRASGNDLAQSIRRFRKEARLLADVQNDHVTKLIDVGDEDGCHFLVMEFIEGVDLKRWIENRKGIAEPEALRLSAELARALVDAHSCEVIHRDVKPENVLLKLNEDAPTRDVPMAQRPIEDFTIKLTDFGIARHVNQSSSMEVTRAGSVMGTPKYMSPEQCKSNVEVGPPADVYSLGITMYELLTGTVPFESDDFMKLAAMHCFDPVPAIQKRNANVSDATARIVHRALAKSPADRFGDAGQLLIEILRLVRGEPVEMESHPKLPANLRSEKLWEKTVSWNLESESNQLWPLVSNTERINEAIGLPSVEYRTEKDPKLGIRKFGTFVLSGVKISWEEHPFEWIEGQRMGILREFDRGPFKWFMSVVSLEPAAGGGTRLSHQVRIEPRNLLGRVLTTVEADWKGFRNLEKVYRRMDRSIQTRLKTSQRTDAFSDAKPLSRHQALRLQQRIARMIDVGVTPDAASAIESILKDTSAQELAQLRPLVMADRLGVEGSQMIDACLHAAVEGILKLRWEILCPTCRVSATTSDKLSQINAHSYCEACDVDFKSNLAGSIEMVFQPHPEIREVNDGKYCIGGPEHSPHVVAQLRIEPNECFDLVLDLGPGDYILRGQGLPRTQSIRVQSAAAPSILDYSLSSLGKGLHTPKLRAGRQTLTLLNDSERLHVVRIERMIPRDDVVTAAMASANPLFRKLFPDQHFATDNPIETEMMTFVATCINNVDELYGVMGDTEAYATINRHHQLLASCVHDAGGCVVKTIGEKMLASFSTREDAILAVKRIRMGLAETMSDSLVVGIGIHSGHTLVTTQNSQLDYFGGTVRAVSCLPEHAGSETLISESLYSDLSVAEQVNKLTDVVEMLNLPGNPNFRVKRIRSFEIE